jgi:hypothetical protein
MSSQSNSRFQRAEAAAIAALDHDASDDVRAVALSRFRRQWLVRERSRQQAYHHTMLDSVWNQIYMSASLQVNRALQLVRGDSTNTHRSSS